jgi:hypothetical protein
MLFSMESNKGFLVKKFPRIIALSGKKGCGKSTVAQHLTKKFGYIEISFAKVLKDIVAILFDWPRDRLEGITPEDRIWREATDEWWSERLNLPHLTPRWVLQNFGTEVVRNHFHDEMWIARLEREISKFPKDQLLCVSDVRFQNEIDILTKYNALFFAISRDSEDKPSQNVHASENIEGLNYSADLTIGIFNRETIDYLFQRIDHYLNNDRYDHFTRGVLIAEQK